MSKQHFITKTSRRKINRREEVEKIEARAMSNQTIKQVCTTRDMDLISALPNNLIETILVKLPFRDATRTCILARSWRYSWVGVPSLKLDAVFWQQSLRINSQGSADKFANILSRILLLHQGPVTSIHLHIPKLESPPEIDTIITFIVRNGVKNFFLDAFPGERYKLHSSLFTCPTLNYLSLRSCVINCFPSTFERCINLTDIEFYGVTISTQALESLVSACRSLKHLKLYVTIDISCLKINAPKLVSFVYCYSSSPQSSIDVNYGQQQRSIVEFFRGFPDLECLSLGAHSVKSLAAGGFPTKLPAGIFNCLKGILLVNIDFDDADLLSFVLCLIRSSPKLQIFKMELQTRLALEENNLENLGEEQDYSGPTLNRLTEVYLSPVVGRRFELKLIKILLAEYPRLRKMKIGLATSKIGDKGLEIIKKMFMFRRASRNVDILIED